MLLSVFTVALVSLSYAQQPSQPLYGDLRDYYPFGLWIKTEKLDYEPEEYTILTNDTYIKQAIDNDNLTWVQQDDPNSTYAKSKFPDYIFWEPNENYYRVHRAYVDGYPAWFRRPKLPAPTETAKLLAIPWAVLLAAVGIQRRIDAKEKA